MSCLPPYILVRILEQFRMQRLIPACSLYKRIAKEHSSEEAAFFVNISEVVLAQLRFPCKISVVSLL